MSYESKFLRDLAEQLYSRLEAMMQISNSKRVREYDALVSLAEEALRDHYQPIEIDGKQANITAAARVTDLRKILKDIFSEREYLPAETASLTRIIGQFGQKLPKRFSYDHSLKNRKYRERVTERSEDESLIEVSLTPWLEKAEGILKKASLGVPVRWEDVSIALALTTGRRQSEIHCSGDFKAIPGQNREVAFTGQLKGKKRKEDGKAVLEVEFRFPTLVDVDLVLAGWEYLKEEGRIKDTPKAVNQGLGKQLSNQMAEWQIVSDEAWKAVDPDDKPGMNYHKLRAIWMRAAIAKIDIEDELGKAKYISQILGDKDLSAMKPYERIKIKI